MWKRLWDACEPYEKWARHVWSLCKLFGTCMKFYWKIIGKHCDLGLKQSKLMKFSKPFSNRTCFVKFYWKLIWNQMDSVEIHWNISEIMLETYRSCSGVHTTPCQSWSKKMQLWFSWQAKLSIVVIRVPDILHKCTCTFFCEYFCFAIIENKWHCSVLGFVMPWSYTKKMITYMKTVTSTIEMSCFSCMYPVWRLSFQKRRIENAQPKSANFNSYSWTNFS